MAVFAASLALGVGGLTSLWTVESEACHSAGKEEMIRTYVGETRLGERRELVQEGKTGQCFCMCNALVLVSVQQFVALGLSHSLVCSSIKWLQLWIANLLTFDISINLPLINRTLCRQME